MLQLPLGQMIQSLMTFVNENERHYREMMASGEIDTLWLTHFLRSQDQMSTVLKGLIDLLVLDGTELADIWKERSFQINLENTLDD